MKRRYLNRELSWVEFNARVLSEAQNPEVPLLERLKFVAIVSSNFDEFFMVRVAGLKRQMRMGISGSCPTGMSPREQLEAIRERIVELTTAKYNLLHNELLPQLSDHGITMVARPNWDTAQRAFLHRIFREQVFPVLTPVRAGIHEPLPYVGNLRLHAAFLLTHEERATAGARTESAAAPELLPEEEGPVLALVQVPPSLGRIVYLPSAPGTVTFALLDHIIAEFGAHLFPGYVVLEQCIFRVARDADFGVDEERDEDFVEAMEQVLEGRDRSHAVRLTLNHSEGLLPHILMQGLDLSALDVYYKRDPLELRHIIELTTLDGYDHLRDERWRHVRSPDIDPELSIWDSIRRRDILLSHPYESFDPIVHLLHEAAADPDVLAIKMTLYRTSGDSPVVRALEAAAEAGKQVAVVVELKARFDEERNISWAARLEKAGAIVVYGIARLKIHAKAILIVRRERGGIRRYAHLGTGNYNDKTARLYTDMGLLTTREDLTAELNLFFNAITGYSVIPKLETLWMAPVALKARVLELIEREASRAESAGSGLIIAKLNALADVEVIDALYEASRRGVKVLLNVRGICMLVPGRKKLSENIRVVSVVDRYLEHTRAMYFANGGAEELYLSSADWMPRNLDRRIELLFPVEDTDLRTRLKRTLQLFFEDTVKAHELQSDGGWVRVNGRKAVRAQEVQYRWALDRLAPDAPESRQEFSVRRKAPEK